MLKLNQQDITNQDYGLAKGYFAENYVAQELTTAGSGKLFSWNERNSEIEFLSQTQKGIIPIEVKAGTRTQAKSLNQFISKYSPDHVIIVSSRKSYYDKERGIKYVPLYLAGKLLI